MVPRASVLVSKVEAALPSMTWWQKSQITSLPPFSVEEL